ncbi:MAG TPA: hypothetical protein VM184_03355 [Gaiellaceae bacterium]|nr:hypothetical protein [Gaiellaceae bacterium]
MSGPPAGAEEQLAAIDDLGAALDESGIDHWLFGGWAVDFCVGEVTRPHADVDVASWRRDYDAIAAALKPAGFRHVPKETDVAGTRYERGAVEVEFTFVAEEDGAVVIPFPDGPIVWSESPFGDERRELLGVSARTIPLALLRAGKSRPRDEEADAAKDVADFEALSRLA